MKQQITKRAITESFRALLAVKPLDKITVRDIVEDCGLTRNTFYYHYEDIYDLLSDVLESEIERALSVPAGGASWETMLLDMLSFSHRFAADRPSYFPVEMSGCHARLPQQGHLRAVGPLYRAKRPRSGLQPAEDRKLICDICCHALYGLLEEWLTGPPDVALEAELPPRRPAVRGHGAPCAGIQRRSSAHLNAI